MSEVRFERPTTLQDALTLAADLGDDARLVSGGTAVSILLKQRLIAPDALISLDRVGGLAEIRREDGHLVIGAMARHRAVETSELVRSGAPLVAEAYSRVATVRLRTQATVGGGLAHADPAQDPPAALIALDAEVVATGQKGERTIPIARFFRDYYETALRPGEIVTAVRVPVVPPSDRVAYLPFLPRSVEDYATVGVAVRLRLDAGVITEARVALIAAAPTPVRAESVESALLGQPASAATFRAAAEAVAGDIDPMDDLRGSTGYKRRMAVVFTRRALEAAVR